MAVSAAIEGVQGVATVFVVPVRPSLRTRGLLLLFWRLCLGSRSLSCIWRAIVVQYWLFLCLAWACTAVEGAVRVAAAASGAGVRCRPHPEFQICRRWCCFSFGIFRGYLLRCQKWCGGCGGPFLPGPEAFVDYSLLL